MGTIESRVSDASFATVVRSHLGDRVVFDHPVAEATTYRVGGRAAFFLLAQSISDLEAIGRLVGETELPVVVIGRGSNVLFADEGFPGLVVQLGEFAAGVDIGGSDSSGQLGIVDVRVGGAVPLPVAARKVSAAGLRGFEWAVGVPGTIGGAIRMNAGGHGSDMAHCLHAANVFDLQEGGLRTMIPSELNLRFRGSDLTDHHIVVSVCLALEQGSAEEAMALIDEIVRWRRANQPGGQNAGSVFINPVPGELSAGELIDRCGLRGFRIGSAEVSDKHANFIQADPAGRAADVVAVMQHVRLTVARETGFQLRSEIRLLGFESDSVLDLYGIATEPPGSGNDQVTRS